MLAAAVALATALTVGAPVAEEPVEEPAEEYRFLFQVTETEGDTAWDSSEYENHGTLKGEVSRRNGTYRFHPLTKGSKFDRIRVPSDPAFNPGSAPFSYGARVKVRPDATWSHSEMALMRHGDSDTPGGDYKLELQRSKSGEVDALCAIHDGDGGAMYIQGNGPLETLDDGEWHTIECARVDEDTVSLTIDGNKPLQKDGEVLGSIDSEDPLLFGAQPFGNRPDLRFREQLHGALDDIYMTVQLPDPPPEP